MGTVATVYADGGCVKKNPSAVGGTWAWRHVDAAGAVLEEDAGYLTCAQAGLPAVSNNVTELLAVVLALEALPEGWSGLVRTDSGVTIFRLKGQGTRKGIPAWLGERKEAALRRLGDVSYELLGGHPTRAELAAGVRRDGKPCSEHNVWCDQACQRQAWLLESKAAAAGAASA